MIEGELVDTLTQNSCKEDAVATRCVHVDQRKQTLCSLPEHTIFCVSLQPIRISGRNRQEETEAFGKLHMGLHKLYSSPKIIRLIRRRKV